MNHWPIVPFLKQQEFRPLDNYVLRGFATRDEVWATARKLLRDFKVEASRYRTHVISAEQLQLLNTGSAQGLRGFFDGLGLQTKVVVYVRHPAERLSSLISQKLRGGQESLRTFLIEDRISPTIRTYAEVFGKDNMIIRRFGPRPISGLNPKRLNESLSVPAVLLADQLFAMNLLAAGARGNERYLDQIVGPKFLAPRSMVREAIEVHRACLDYLEKEFGIQFAEVDLSTFPEVVSREMSSEALASIATFSTSRAWPSVG